mgnify:FL=1
MFTKTLYMFNKYIVYIQFMLLLAMCVDFVSILL